MCVSNTDYNKILFLTLFFVIVYYLLYNTNEYFIEKYTDESNDKMLVSKIDRTKFISIDKKFQEVDLYFKTEKRDKDGTVTKYYLGFLPHKRCEMKTADKKTPQECNNILIIQPSKILPSLPTDPLLLNTKFRINEINKSNKEYMLSSNSPFNTMTVGITKVLLDKFMHTSSVCVETVVSSGFDDNFTIHFEQISPSKYYIGFVQKFKNVDDKTGNVIEKEVIFYLAESPDKCKYNGKEYISISLSLLRIDALEFNIEI